MRDIERTRFQIDHKGPSRKPREKPRSPGVLARNVGARGSSAIKRMGLFSAVCLQTYLFGVEILEEATGFEFLHKARLKQVERFKSFSLLIRH
jgi:hypothetical protein